MQRLKKGLVRLGKVAAQMLGLVAFFCAILPTLSEGKTVFIHAGAPGAATGVSWPDAYTNLQDGLAAAANGDELWVAAGTYRPDRGKGIAPGSRTATFTLKPDLAIYGGFAGMETTLAARDWNKNRVILSGDLAGNDLPDFTKTADNSNHVVSFSSNMYSPPYPTALLDGVTVTGGIFYNDDGAGIYLLGTSPIIRNCLIAGNIATSDGGGISSGRGNPLFENCIFSGNSAGRGGALFVSSGTPVISGCTVINNRGDSGGGIYITSGATIKNSIFWGNTATSGPQMYIGINPLEILSSDVQGGKAAIGNNPSYTVTTYQDNIDADPLLTRDGHLTAGSPCINAAAAALTPSVDIDGEARPSGTAPDMGADEFVDSDGDGLADAWELLTIGNLAATGADDQDADGLTNAAEYRLATSPTAADTDGDGYTDLVENERGTDPLTPISYPGRFFVRAGATGAATGASWADAYTNLQDGLTATAHGCEIWVAAGTYRPDQGKGIAPGNRNATFELKADVAIYGGFSGTETTLAARDWNKNKTILSGDLAGNDMPFFTNRGDNSITSVVSFSKLSDRGYYPAALLDGFTIAGGSNSYDGGGMKLSYTSPVIRNCIITDNSSGRYGGGIYNEYGSPRFENCRISGNSATQVGGAFYDYYGTPVFSGCTVIHNGAASGGGIYSNSGAPRVENSILWGNTADAGPQIYLDYAAKLSVIASDVQFGQAGIYTYSATIVFQNNIDVDPLLTTDGHLLPSSPCIDAGDPTLALAIDSDGEARPYGASPDQGADEFVDSDSDGLADTWERRWLGSLDATTGVDDSDADGLTNAAEYRVATDPVAADTDGDGYSDGNEVGAGTDPLGSFSYIGRIYVKAGATGTATGASWADAYTNLQDGLSAVWPGCELWVAAGTYQPDQGKGITPGDRNATFKLQPDVAIYGGFAGTESTLAGRDLEKNKTILSGDLRQDDGPYISKPGENSMHVVTFSNMFATSYPSALVDGFRVSGGVGGGMLFTKTNPVVRNCVITGNHGRGVYTESGNPRFENCLIMGNNNTITNGGGIYVASGAPVFSGCSVLHNKAAVGGGLHGSGIIKIDNSIFWGNTAPTGKQIYFAGNLTIVASDIQGGEAAIVKGTGAVMTYQGNIDADPLVTGDGHLRAASPCIDAGEPSQAAVIDMDGEARPQGTAPDLGADEFVDTDADGLPDFWERRWLGGLGAATAGDDTDADGLTNETEYRHLTNPTAADSDGDGYPDQLEMEEGTDPLYPRSYPGRIYVKADATGSASGASWADAYTSLQDALAVAVPGCELWVAAGTYRPDQGRGITPGNRGATFGLSLGVAIYGGFAGNETTLAARDTQKNRTILSGDLVGDDGAGFTNYTENSFHVVTYGYNSNPDAPGTTPAVLDGFTVTHGNAESSVGAGIYLKSGVPRIRNCTITGNLADSGGGIYNDSYSLVLEGCTISGNRAIDSSGMYSNAPTTIMNSIISGNLGGSVLTFKRESRLLHCTIVNNQSSWGAVYISPTSDYDFTVTMENSIIWGNSGGQIVTNYYHYYYYTYSWYFEYFGYPSLTLTHCDLMGGMAGIMGNASDRVTAQSLSSQAPQLSADGHLLPGSPCIDRGDPASTEVGDIDGEARPAGAAPDLGADEFSDSDADGLPDFWEQKWLGGLGATGTDDSDHDGLVNKAEYSFSTSPNLADSDGDGASDFLEVERGANPLDPDIPSNPIFVRAGATGAATGTSWANAFTNLQDALAAATVGREIWIAAGTYRPDQGKGVTPGDQSATFKLKQGVAIYGGFAGTETILAQRDWNKNKAILSGDLAGNDRLNFVNADENSRQVVSATFDPLLPYLLSLLLDGVTVTGGGGPDYSGTGGMFISGTSPVVRNCVITGNRGNNGGGVFIEQGSPRFENCIIMGNSATSGGGVYGYDAGLIFSGCTVINNEASNGGGLFAIGYSSIWIESSIFWGNRATLGPQLSVYTGCRLSILGSNIQGGQAAIPLTNFTKSYVITIYQGNIDVDPLLTRDGHLLPGSPCIDVGTAFREVAVDIDGEPRPRDAAPDIGADEFKDSDGDGLPDSWELHYGLDPFDNGTVVGKNGAAGDPDGDGFTNSQEYLHSTSPIASLDNDGDGFTVTQGDCNDLEPTVYPGATEICDTLDNNCNGQADDADFTVVYTEFDHWYKDQDGDGGGAYGGNIYACRQPLGFINKNRVDWYDCNDLNPTVYYGAPELADGIDNDCNGYVDDKQLYYDRDGDGYPVPYSDCDDTDPAINPGAAEIDDGIDNNCDGRVDEHDPALVPVWYADADGDGYGNPADMLRTSTRPAGYVADHGDCDDSDAGIRPSADEVCGDDIDNNCNGLIDDLNVCPPPMGCLFDAQCALGEYCRKPEATCNGVGACQPLPTSTDQCPALADPVCGCDGREYANTCEAERLGVSVAAKGQCAATTYKWPYYFPSVKDNDAIGWENYLSVQAKDPLPMEVTIRVYDLAGMLAGTFIYSDTDPAAKAKAVAPNARVAQRPSLIAGGAIEGSIIVETSVPAIATTNCIASFYKGFSIYEAAKVRSTHFFPKAYDGPDFYQVYMVVQNIFPEPRKVTAVLSGKTTSSPGHGANQTTTIPAYGTWKFRPSDIAGGINFDGSVGVYSDLYIPRDGLGPAIPAMCRYEAGTEAIAIYESTAPQPRLFFPVLKDGKFGTTLDYQNFMSVVNMNQQAANVTVVLYNKSGVEEGRVTDTIPASGKKTWRPGWIKGSAALPADFEGLAVIASDQILIGQTNTIYPGANKYGVDAFDLLESAMRGKTLLFPKAYDNLPGAGIGETHLLDNFVYVSNPDANNKTLKIEQFNNNGTANGAATVELPPYATHVYRPKNLVTDNSGIFRGSVKVTEQNGLSITGAIKYEVHKTTAASSGIEAMTIYRSMGQ